MVDTDAAADASGTTPTPKKKPPETGWLSAETTCQLTTYVPLSSPERIPTTASLPACPCRAAPSSTRWPDAEMTVIEPAFTVTDSLKVSVTRDGAAG